MGKSFLRPGRIAPVEAPIYEDLIAEQEKRYTELQSNWRDGKFQNPERDLMIDGLLKQFITSIDEA